MYQTMPLLAWSTFQSYFPILGPSLPVFGHVFFNNLLNKSEMDNEQISDIISMYFNINNSSVALIRAITLIKWIRWIKNNHNN